MRIAFDNQIFSTQSWGGISRYFVRLAEELHVNGEDVRVMAHFHKNHHLEESSLSLIGGRSVTSWPRRFGKLAMNVNPALLSRSLARWPPDIFHETYYKGQQRPALNAPVVVTVYDMIHEIMPEVFRQDDQTPQRKKKAVLRADHIICISENTRQDLLRLLDVNPEKTSVVHLGVDMPAANDTHGAAPESIRQRPFVLYVGNRGGYKNFLLLIRAVAYSRHLKDSIDIVCFGGGSLSKEELTLAAELGIKPDQLRHDSGDDTRLAKLFQQASVFVHSSKYEGFGLPPLEAMAQGCPVISSNTSCMPEVLGNAAHYFNPQSVEELSEALDTLLGSSEKQLALQRAGFEHCKTMTWNRCAQNTLRVYESIVS